MRLIALLLLLLPATATAQPADVSRAALLADIEFLSSDELAGRKAGTPGNAVARAFILSRFKSLGLEPHESGYLHEFEQGTNVYGIRRGITHPDRYLVISAHYDHLGTRGDKIFNGADDNASGTAALFAIAAAIAEPSHSILFAAFDAEEGGLRGARAFLKDNILDQGAIAMNVNMDMISHSDKGELYAAGAFRYPELREILAPVVEEARIKLLFGHDDPRMGADDWTGQSDQGPFHSAGIPWIYFGVEDHPQYHDPSDTFDTITKDFYVDAVRTILSAVRALDRQPASRK